MGNERPPDHAGQRRSATLRENENRPRLPPGRAPARIGAWDRLEGLPGSVRSMRWSRETSPWGAVGGLPRLLQVPSRIGGRWAGPGPLKAVSASVQRKWSGQAGPDAPEGPKRAGRPETGWNGQGRTGSPQSVLEQRSRARANGSSQLPTSPAPQHLIKTLSARARALAAFVLGSRPELGSYSQHCY